MERDTVGANGGRIADRHRVDEPKHVVERECKSVYASSDRTIPVNVREFGTGEFPRCGPFGSIPSNDSFPITMD